MSIAKAVYPNWAEIPTMADLDARFPLRNLPAGAFVTRVGPSPTGMMHIGGLYTALINERLARQSNGIFFLRVEDTDQKRTVEGAYETIVSSLQNYTLYPDEGPRPDPNGKGIIENGIYGPYVQSNRREIYHAVAFDLLQRGLAYPCFMTEQEIESIRQMQQTAAIKPGIYGEYAHSRHLTPDEVLPKIAQRVPFVIRFKAEARHGGTLTWHDEIRGTMAVPENDLDVVIIKSDGLPTYHFAHLVDDHFMRTTHVVRAEEWIASVPLHIQLYEAMGWEHPKYGHIGAIHKMEGGSKRKLSKRKDPEADVRYYWEQGFPRDAVIEYLLNLANSSFEDWRKANPTTPNTSFEISLSKMQSVGPLADLVKMESISKQVLAAMPVDDLYNEGLRWTKEFNAPLAVHMEKDPSFTKKALNVERGVDVNSKRLVRYTDLTKQIGPFFPELLPPVTGLEFPEQISTELRNSILVGIKEKFTDSTRPEEVFEMLKGIAASLGFATSAKEFKAEPTKFKGQVGDVAMVVRVAMFGSRQSPDLGQVMTVIGKAQVDARCDRIIRQ